MEFEIGEINFDDEINIGEIEVDYKLDTYTTEVVNVVPSQEPQTIFPSEADAISQVNVEPISNDYVKPSGTLEITTNGNYDVKEFLNAEVKTSGYDTSDSTATPEDITEGKTAYIAEGKVVGTAPQYWDLTKKKTGALSTYLINAPIPDTSEYTSLNDFFGDYGGSELPFIDTSNCKNFVNFSYKAKKVIKFPQFDFSKGTTFGSCFPSGNDCLLEEISLLDFSSATSVGGMFGAEPNLRKVDGFKNLGLAYKETTSANNYAYKVGLTNAKALTEQSLINILNNLYDIASKGCNTQSCNIGSENVAKLSSEAGQKALADATAKGWTIS